MSIKMMRTVFGASHLNQNKESFLPPLPHILSNSPKVSATQEIALNTRINRKQKTYTYIHLVFTWDVNRCVFCRARDKSILPSGSEVPVLSPAGRTPLLHAKKATQKHLSASLPLVCLCLASRKVLHHLHFSYWSSWSYWSYWSYWWFLICRRKDERGRDANICVWNEKWNKDISKMNRYNRWNSEATRRSESSHWGRYWSLQIIGDWQREDQKT